LAGTSLLIKKRLLVVLISFSTLVIALLVRLGWIQIVHGDMYQQMAFDHRISGIEITARRGTIYDKTEKSLL
jgi:stage V sporulation protein D (sporulation-specific penicillin-binding protein)